MVNQDLYENRPYDMVVFCHLRWDFVYQRPQHLISRLAGKYKILVVEEPLQTRLNGKGPFELRVISDHIHICRPPVARMEDIGPYLKKQLRESTFHVGWFYSPAFISVLDEFEFDTVVYDCMDELTLFRGADPGLVAQEEKLLSAADVVFTGGKSLYESKMRRHHHVHCFPSSVDIEHFEGSSGNEASVPGGLEHIPHPIVGYYGVIDERIDLELLRQTAAITPEASFVMIGPLCKISEEDLPRAQNIHYLGMKTYAELPSYLKHFDIAMMPFALNEATRFISPTKTLEYMAAGKPIISTPITDVVRDYRNCIMLVSDAQDFRRAVVSPELSYPEQYRAILENTSWDHTAEQMDTVIEKTLA